MKSQTPMHQQLHFRNASKKHNEIKSTQTKFNTKTEDLWESYTTKEKKGVVRKEEKQTLGYHK